MSDVSDAARVQVLLADYAVADASNKINALGIGFQLAPLPPSSAATAPHSVTVLVDVPPSFAGADLAFELALVDEAGDVVSTPGAAGAEPSALRFAQNVTLQNPATNLTMPGYRIPRDALWCRHQLIATLQAGVHVRPGQAYEWRASIDTVSRPDWAVRFYVPAPAGGVVFG